MLITLDETQARRLARALIHRFGDDLPSMLETKISGLFDARQITRFSYWFIVRNAVTLELNDQATRH